MMKDGGTFTVHPCFQLAVNCCQKIVTMVANMESEQIVCQQPPQNILLPGTDAKRFWIRPGNMPELGNEKIGPCLFEQMGEQVKTIILKSHDRRFLLDVIEDGLGKLDIDPYIGFPIAKHEAWTSEHNMADRPQCVVGEAVIITCFPLFCEP